MVAQAVTRHDLLHAKEVMRDRGIRAGWGNALIVHAALERGLLVAGTRGGRVRISNEKGKAFYWRNGVSNINHRLARQIVPQKEATSRILRAAGFSAGNNVVFGADELERAWAWARFGLPVVVKPYNASQGRGVHVGIGTYEDFSGAFASVASGFGDVLVEELITGVEHRALVVDNVLIAATRRVPANVTGDGSSTVSDLIAQKNGQRGVIHKKIAVDVTVESVLRESGLTLDSVPPKGRLVLLRKTSNLHTGGDAVDATNEFSDEEKRFIEGAARAIPGLRVAGFGVLLPRPDGTPTILEVNPFPMISMHHFPAEGPPRDVAGAVVDAMF